RPHRLSRRRRGPVAGRDLRAVGQGPGPDRRQGERRGELPAHGLHRRATDGGEYMPEIAARVGLKLVPGAWIYSANEAKLQFGREAGEVNAEETRALIRMANQTPNIERLLVGNENILRWDGQKDLRDPNAVSPAQLIREIRTVKRNVKVPVSTGEPWHIWLR